ncbi:aldo/keto reductase [Paenibacillus humicola]|uniref:aldo/keto reductase n=1 Tax=Paenibacillus humicola TaxID=3110540 RepID=UPI00237A5070|nr:aldo/keto reductase [Paenibacillus humicola]
MEYRTVGKTGIQVSSLCFGTMSFGGNADEETSKKMFRRCREAGINFFDTANAYSMGVSEQILGACIADCRDEIVLTTKVFNPMGQDINARGLSRRHIMLEVENSLRRLQTDRIDFYFVHQFDRTTPMEETLRALDDLQQQGKILYPAVSNWAAWQIAKALGIAAKEQLARFELIQPMYNLVKRQAEVEILPLAESEQIGVIPYSPLGGGLLSGKYGLGRKPEQGRLVENKMYTARYGDPMNFEVAERFTAYAEEREIHPATLAVAWVMSNPAVTAPIIGARNLEQLECSLAALDLNMTPEWRKEISALSITPPPATDRTEEVMS